MFRVTQNIHFHLSDSDITIPFVFTKKEEVQEFCKFCDALFEDSEYVFEWEEESSGNVFSLNADVDTLVITVHNKTGLSVEWRLDVSRSVKRSFKGAKNNISKFLE